MLILGGTCVVLVEVCQFVLQGVGGRVNSASSIDLPVRVGYVALNGSDAYDQGFRDFTVA